MTSKIDNEQRAREQFAKLFQAPTPKQTTTQAPAAPQRRVWKVSK